MSSATAPVRAPARRVRAPAPSLTAVCESPPPAGSARKTPPARFAAPSARSSASASGSRSPSCATARPAAIDSTNDISATPAAAGSSGPISERSGATGVGRPAGTEPVSATSSSPAAPIAIPPTTATSAPGTAGTQRLSANIAAIVPPASAAVGPLMSPRFSSAERAFWKKLSPSCGIPSTFPSCPTAISSPVPALNPASTGWEMKSARKPSRSSDAPRSSTPVSIASVEAAARARSASPSATVTTAAPVSAASVEVVLTESAREVPSSA